MIIERLINRVESVLVGLQSGSLIRNVVTKHTADILDLQKYQLLQGKAASGEDLRPYYTEDLQPGDRVHIAWLPDRTCILEYLGDYRWRIAEVHHSKLHTGDTFSCRVIAQNQPLVVDHLHSGGQIYDGYVIGGKTGLTIVERLIG